MKQIILASTSPRRKKLLEQLGLKFKVVPSHYEEKMNPRLKPKGQAEFLSEEKAKAVAEKFPGEDVIIISADGVIDFRGETVGKPKSTEDAKRTLARFSGETHTSITAFTIINPATKRTVTKSVETKVTMKKLTPKEIDQYVATGEPFDRAGSYGIDQLGGSFITSIEGDYFNVVGISLRALVEELKRFGISIFS